MRLHITKNRKNNKRETGVSHTAKVTGQAGKAKAISQSQFTILRSVEIAGNMRSADLTQVEDLQVEPLDNVEVRSDVLK